MTPTRTPRPPIAIIGMGLRLPGGVTTPEEFWDMIINKRDGRCRVPADRYNIDAFYNDKSQRQAVATEYGYFLKDVNFKTFDTSFFPALRSQLAVLETIDPRQRLLLEVAWECMESAGQTDLSGSDTGVYVGVFGQDWHDLMHKDTQIPGVFKIASASDFALSTQISRMFDLRGPSLTVQTGCSATMTGLHLACQALYNGDCSKAVVAGASVIMCPSMTMDVSQQNGVLSPDGRCKTFDASADGYVRAEAVNAIMIKPLADAIRDKDPIRAIIRSTAVNADGNTAALGVPSPKSHEVMIRKAYESAGIDDFSQTTYIECHGTGTRVGDPMEASAIAKVFGGYGAYLGSVKPNVGHSEGASGITSLIKAVLALEKETIPPNIYFSKPNPRIPFEEAKLKVPVEPIPWPKGRNARISVNSFGIGGSNAHVILDSASSIESLQSQNIVKVNGNGAPSTTREPVQSINSHSPSDGKPHLNGYAHKEITNGESNNTCPCLIPVSATNEKSLKTRIDDLQRYITTRPDSVRDLAHTMGNYRTQLPYRNFAIVAPDGEHLETTEPFRKPYSANPKIAFVFTGQGAQWAGMGKSLLLQSLPFRQYVNQIDHALQNLPEPPKWKIEDMLLSECLQEVIDEAEYSQPLCAAMQIGLVSLLSKFNIKPAAVVGHSSGEIAAAYAAGLLTMDEAIVCAYLRGQVTKRQTRIGRMAAIGMGPDEIAPYLVDGVQLACENSSRNVTISGDPDALEQVVQKIKDLDANIFIKQLPVKIAYHSDHMREVSGDYAEMLTPHLISKGADAIPFYSTLTGALIKPESNLIPSSPQYWKSNLESPVKFHDALLSLLKDMPSETVLIEVGTHSSLQGLINKTLQETSSTANKGPVYVPTLSRGSDSVQDILTSAGRIYSLGHAVNFSFINPPTAKVLTDLPNYPWDHDTDYWNESRISRAWRFMKHPHHEILGSSCLEASEAEPAWRNLLRAEDAPWLADHKFLKDIVFPCAGYIAMLGEAIRQVLGTRAYTLRNLAIKSALVVPATGTVEIMTTMRPLRLTDYTVSSNWYEFTISSFNGTIWVQNCLAQGKAGEEAPPQSSRASIVPFLRLVSETVFYEQFKRCGMNFGPRFQGLTEIIVDPTETKATSMMQMNEEDRTAPYLIHPLAIDQCLQLCPVARSKGVLREITKMQMPAKIGLIKVCSGSPNLIAEATCHTSDLGQVYADVVAMAPDSNEIVIRFENIVGTSMDLGIQDEKLKSTDITRLEWRPHLDYLSAQDLLRLGRGNERDNRLAIEKCTALCILRMVDLTQSLDTSASNQHIIDYVSWLHREKDAMLRGDWDLLVPEAKQWASNDQESIKTLLVSLRQGIEATGNAEAIQFVKTASRMIQQEAISAISSGALDPAKLFAQENISVELNGISNGLIDPTEFFSLCAHLKPAARILEIGADGSGLTQTVLDSLRSRDDVHMFSDYVVTNPSEAVVDKLRQIYNGTEGLKFQELDISKGVVEEDPELGQFDLVVISNMFPSTETSHRQLLQNARSLLRPEGRLFLHGLLIPSNWRYPTFIKGLLPEWSFAANINQPTDSPVLSQAAWEQELRDAGFSGIDGVILDDQDANYHLTSSLVSTTAATTSSAPTAVTLLYNKEKHEFAHNLASILEKQGIEIIWRRISDEEESTLEIGESNGDIISTVDLEGPYMHNMSQDEYNILVNFFSKSQDRRVLWLTRAAQLHCTDPRYGLLPGLARNVRLEIALNLWTVELQSLDSSTLSMIPVLFESFHNRPSLVDRRVDSEFAIHNGTVYIGRYHWTPIQKEIEAPATENDYKQIVLGETMVTDSLHWVNRKPQELQDHQVEIDIRAVGLNFRDIMIAMGLMEGKDDVFGFEASGVITRVGSTVTDLKIGDRVMTTEDGLFCTRRMVPSNTAVRIPDELSFEDAATMPIVYMTVIHAIIDIGRLAKGQSILIHSACGGVGQAAIHICKMIGAEIYTTVGSDEKAKYLMEEHDIPRERIFHSRNDSFLDAVMQATNGRGVDMVLNSLSGDLLHASWQCVAKRGKMLEIGKRDMLERGYVGLDLFQHNRSFFGIDLGALCRDFEDEAVILLRKVVELYNQGYARPIRPIQAYTSDQIPQAFRYMQKGQHTGKIIVTLPEAKDDIPATLSTQGVKLSPTATYLMIGGLGGLGKAVVSWMVVHGATSFVFLSRSAGKRAEDQAFFRELESQGCRAVAVAGSVAEMEDVQRAVGSAPTPIAGVFQMSMVSRDSPLVSMSYEDWRTSQDPKVIGTWNLHNALLGTSNLDFFIMTSSLTGLLGLPFQANYASANSFLDSFMQYRHSLNLPCSVLDLGVMEDIGFVSNSSTLLKQYRGIGAYMVQEQEFMDAIQVCIQKSQPRLSKTEARDAYINPSQFGIGLVFTKQLSGASNASPIKVDVRMDMYHRMDASLQPSAESKAEGLHPLLDLMKSEPELLHDAETVRLIILEMGRTLCGLMSLPQDELEITASLTSMGIDSLVSVEVRNWWRRTLGTDVSVLEIINSSTIEGLGKLAINLLKQKYSVMKKVV